MFGYSFFTLIAAIIYFMLIRRNLSQENLFLLSMERMIIHRKKYISDYKSKLVQKSVSIFNDNKSKIP